MNLKSVIPYTKELAERHVVIYGECFILLNKDKKYIVDPTKVIILRHNKILKN